MTDTLYKWLAIILGGMLFMLITAFLGASIKAQFETATSEAVVAAQLDRLAAIANTNAANSSLNAEQLDRQKSRLDQLEQELVRLREAATYPQRRAK